jgi:hypothetical protein
MPPLARALLRDPLTHFLIAGAAIFVAASALAPPDADERRIVVDRASLLQFIQFRSKAFEPDAAAATLGSLNAEQRAALIDDYVREEVLYREAKALGLAESDYVIRQRIVQKFEFAADAAIADDAPAAAEIEAFYAAHQKDYEVDTAATFTHVFFDAESRGFEGARAAAAEMARSLNAKNAPFEAAIGKGDRFPFHVNYVRRSYREAVAQFGDAAAQAIFDRGAPRGVWRGPISSAYGAHAIFVRAVEPARTPPLAEIRDRVIDDLVASRRAAAREAIIAGAIGRYVVVDEVSPPETTLAER